MQTIPVIGANGKVYFCHDKAYSSSGVLGDIKDKSFKDLWFSEESQKIFKSFNPEEKCQHHCANEIKNRLINNIIENKEGMDMIIGALDCYEEDVNFI